MSILRNGNFRTPAWVEFSARLAHAARRRGRPARSRRPDRAGPPHPVPPLGPDALGEALSRLEVRRGGTLMVHSSSEAIERLGWKPSALIDFLLDYLGPDGTLAMPSHPKLLDQDGKQVYDVRRSPSTVGLVTELFRRRRGVLRSGFPFSAATALGPRAEELTAAHARSFAPHDEHSPYARLADAGGQVLAVGCPLDHGMTILHDAEDVERASIPFPGFHRPCVIWVKSGDAFSPVTAHVRAPWLWWYLHLSGWTFDMYHRGLARTLAVSGLPLHVAEARPTVEWMRTEVLAGRTIYPLARMNRWLKLGDHSTS